MTHFALDPDMTTADWLATTNLARPLPNNADADFEHDGRLYHIELYPRARRAIVTASVDRWPFDRFPHNGDMDAAIRRAKLRIMAERTEGVVV